MAQVLSPPSPVVSSSSTLWATASKEWVIPAKPKPGRKPKKDQVTPAPTPASSSLEVTDPAGRRVQNRAAQRAFRERKQSQLAELQTRIQQYEQGEIERNVALQTVAKRLKEENDKLRDENTVLKAKVAQLEQERAEQQTKDVDNKRWRDDASGVDDYADPPARKKTRLAVDTFSLSQNTQGIPLSFIPSPPSLASSPGSNDASDHCFSPLPVASPTQDPAVFPTQMSPIAHMFDFQSSSRPQAYESAVPMDQFDCGFCNDNTPCVCREIALQSSAERVDVSAATTTFKAEMVEQTSMDLTQTSSISASTIMAPQSILDNLPAYQPPIPFRRRATNPLSKSLFPVAPPQSDCSAGRGIADCSGDPSNCPACADDVFGKAFCTAIGESVASQTVCADCPSRGGQQQQPTASTSRLCCGNPAFCNGGGCSSSSSSPPTYVPAPVHSDTIPTSDAWRQIKSHPNVTFADLSLLADVVARRSKCTGPTVVISPAPGAFTPERSNTPARAFPRQPDLPTQPDAVLLSDPHAHYHQKERERSNTSASPPPRLVPHDELVNCARGRALREVHADGVREALRLLDTRFGRP
ncbi:hypothetical protein OF83DRAFT_1065309 [Amylostereum chailletii]|nr:hypothetical protein OF83DRAFT_1065309 [Amylostereum chailletii]